MTALARRERRAVARRDEWALALPGVVVSETALELPEDLPFEDWQRVGDTLGRVGRAHQWWIGDWLNGGERNYGEKYAQAIDATGYDYSAVTGMAWVAKEVELCRRRQNLSWGHHAEVASLEPAEQDRWLDLAEAEGLGVHELRRRVKAPPTLEAPDTPDGRYRCIVLDPPWPVEKIERDVRPNQAAPLDYQTMSVDEIAALPIPDLAADGCHIYLWVTHKHMPAGLGLLGEWGARYECSLTWVKPTGMTPFSWMYNTEHALFARIGSLPLSRKGLKLGFTAAAARHSQKPDAFYDNVLAASPGPRIDMFARGRHDGFDAWGNETERLPDAA